MLRPGSRTIVESQHHVRLDFLIKWRQFCEKSEEPLGSAIYSIINTCSVKSPSAAPSIINTCSVKSPSAAPSIINTCSVKSPSAAPSIINTCSGKSPSAAPSMINTCSVKSPFGSAIYHQYLQCEESLGSAIYRRLSNLDHGGLVGIADQRICVFGLYGLVTFTYRLLHLVLRVTRQQSGLRSIKSSACHCYTVVAVQCTVYVV